jgi:hypothetical protein
MAGGALVRLASELSLAEALLFKHTNQHRRTPAFRSFRSSVVAVRRFLAAIRAENAAGAGAGAGAARAAALRARLLAHARRATAAQRGAGFATLFAAVAALLASMLALVGELREELLDR